MSKGNGGKRVGLPRIYGEGFALKRSTPFLRQQTNPGDIEAQVARAVGREILLREREESRCRAESAPVLRVPRAEVLFLQMDESARELDEALEKKVVRSRRAQPELLQHIVGFVILTGIEHAEPARVARMQVRFIAREVRQHGLNTFAFFHRGKSGGDYLPPRSARQARPLANTDNHQNFPASGATPRLRSAVMQPETLLLIVLVFLAVASAFISAVETALFAIQPQHLDALKEGGTRFGARLAAMLENPRRLLSTILLADALVNAPLLVGALALIQSQSHFDLPSWALALILLALIVFICDLLPKLFALGIPVRVAKLGVPVFAMLTPLLDPIARLLQNFAERFAEVVLPAALKKQRHISEEEIDTLVELSSEQGALHETESEMISEIIKLGDKTAHDCMTPRVDMFTLPDDLTNEEAIAMLRKHRFHRVPVYGETPDDIEGVLDVAAFLRDTSVHYTECLDVPSFIPDTMKAVTLLNNFLKHPQNAAVVVDEHGGVEGVITMSDLVEEIISDAVPNSDAKLYLESIGEGVLIANGNARLEDITEELGVEFAEEGVDTIGGLIFHHLGHLPKQGQEIKLAGIKVLIRRVSKKRIEELQLMAFEEVAE